MMKTASLSILLLLTYAAATFAQTPKQNQVLFDFRQSSDRGPETRTPAATERSVLAKVFRKFLTDGDKCNRNFEITGDDRLKSLRAAGEFVPSIGGQISGSFTAPGTKQTAYLILVGECDASHAEAYGSKRMAIFSGDKLVLDVDIDYKNSIVRKTDLDGDGVDELLLISSDMGQGVVTEMAMFVDFKNGRLNKIEDFGQVSEDSCASGLPGGESIGAVLSYPPTLGGMPKLRIDHYRKSCRRGQPWRFKSTGKLS